MAYTAPTSADVAALLRTRTKGANSQYAADFSTDSQPTKAQVETLITLASGLILPGLGSLADADLSAGCKADVWNGAKALVTLGAAMLVEASHFPEQQQQGDQTIARLLQDLLEGDFYDRLARAAAACRGESGGGDEDSGSAAAPQDASWAFPQDRGGMIGHGTRW